MVVALIAARTDTRWWHHDVARSAHVFLLKGRLRFGDGQQSAPFPSALVVWGANGDTVSRLKDVLSEAWHVNAVEGAGRSETGALIESAGL